MKYCISDLHLFHTNILKYDNRPFTNITEHDETIIKNWNSVVNHDDEVYYLGDFCFKPHIAEKYVNRLNGRIYYIKGNHEQCLSSKIVRDRFEWIKDYYELKYQGHMFCMFHYAILEWNKGHRGSIHLHGHTHGGLVNYPELKHRGLIL